MRTNRLFDLGWKSYFENQIGLADEPLVIVRTAAHLGSQLLCLSATDELLVPIPLVQRCGDIAVGDWLLLDPQTHRATRRLERLSVLTRKAAGDKVSSQMIAANLDTLFIVSSCNHEFNLSRLERYLALAAEAEVHPIVVLSKADLCDHPEVYRREAEQLKAGLVVETVNARSIDTLDSLMDWCRRGQTVGLVGSSGVGKSTLAMSLGAEALATHEIRENDSKGRHTTTTRSLHALSAGGLLIDTPGMRELQLADCQQGIDDVFEEIVALGETCRFRDCTHQNEPACAVRAAIETGALDGRRLRNYQKLQAEQSRNGKSLRERREESRKLGKYYKSVLASKKQRKDAAG